MKPLALLTVAALGFLLSGCFTSETPKFPLSSSVAAFGNGGNYGVFEYSDGKYSRQGSRAVKRLPDGSYEFGDDKSPLPVSFHDIGNGVIVAQAKNEAAADKRYPYSYSILTRQGPEFFLHVPQCDRLDAALLAAHRVVFIGNYECSVEGAKDLAKLFAAIPAGDPTFKFVPE
jgi:hypothetical protein